jgi:hypothetical protein
MLVVQELLLVQEKKTIGNGQSRLLLTCRYIPAVGFIFFALALALTEVIVAESLIFAMGMMDGSRLEETLQATLL